MNSHLSTRSLLIALAVLIATACVYFLFSTLSGGGARGGMDGNASQLTVEEKAEVLHSLTQPSEGNAAVTPSEAAERQRMLESVAQSSSDSPAAKQSAAEKARILESLQSQ
jgi:hypothetical protein